MRPAKNPFLVVIINFLVGIAVANNLVPVEHQSFYTEALSDVVGYGIIFATSLVSLVQVWKGHHIPTEITPLSGQESIPVVQPPVMVAPPADNPSSENLPDSFRG